MNITMQSWESNSSLLFKNRKINTRFTVFPIFYAVCLVGFFYVGRLTKFSITLWAYVAFFPSVAFLEQCSNIVIVNNFSQHFLILKFLLIFCVPEACLASAQAHTQPFPLLLLCLNSRLISNFQDVFILATLDFSLRKNGGMLAYSI